MMIATMQIYKNLRETKNSFVNITGGRELNFLLFVLCTYHKLPKLTFEVY